MSVPLSLRGDLKIFRSYFLEGTCVVSKMKGDLFFKGWEGGAGGGGGGLPNFNIHI